MTLTIDDITAGYDNEAWLGFGYLGERQNATDSSDPECPPRWSEVDAADFQVVMKANELGWTAGELFAFLNSKCGRWVAGELIFSDRTPANIRSADQMMDEWNALPDA